MKNKDKIVLTNLKTDEHAVDFLIRSASEHPKEITLICLAPMTNIADAIRRDPTFASKIKHLFVLGGTYKAHGNTPHYCSEFNFYLDYEAASLVFESFKDNLIMVPYENCTKFRKVPVHEVNKVFTFRQTPKGEMVHYAFEAAYKYSGVYMICDPLAVAVAFRPEIVTRHFKKECLIETEGKFTKGMVAINWLWPFNNK